MTWLILARRYIQVNDILKILKNDKKVIFRIKDNNSACVRNDKLKYISPFKVSKGSGCVNVSLIFSENLRSNNIMEVDEGSDQKSDI